MPALTAFRPARGRFLILAWLLLPTCLCGSTSKASAQRDPWTSARRRMVREEVEGAGIKDPRVCDAIRQTPRHLFVPATQRQWAYLDMALPIGEGQTISPPFVVAKMTQALKPQPSDRVLEIGTGSGYQSAILSPLVAEVYSIEIVPSLGRTAQKTLRRLQYKNVQTRIGDGYEGWPEHAPFDKIIVTCSPERIPTPLVDQLREGGLIVVPLGERFQQTLYRFKKEGGEMKAEALEPTFFVPMKGVAEERRGPADDSGVPQLINGDYETTDDKGNPQGWYYVRQAQIARGASAGEGEQFLKLRNTTPGRGAQALQALGLDGRKVKTLEFSLLVATRDVRPGRSSKELPRIGLSFFDQRRAPLGTEQLGPWTGTTQWSQQQARIKVPVRCRLAVLSVSMLGAVGELSVDQLSLRVLDE